MFNWPVHNFALTRRCLHNFALYCRIHIHDLNRLLYFKTLYGLNCIKSVFLSFLSLQTFNLFLELVHLSLLDLDHPLKIKVVLHLEVLDLRFASFYVRVKYLD